MDGIFPEDIAKRVPLASYLLTIGGEEWNFSAVRNQDALLDAADDIPQFPYGLLLWESAVGLAEYLTKHPHLVRGKRVLELGCGVGVAGIVARKLGGLVWQTDHLAYTLQLAKANEKANGVVGIERFVGDWRNWNHKDRYDIVLGADIIYERAMHSVLPSVFSNCLVDKGTLLLSDPDRPQSMDFLAYLEALGWKMSIESLPVCLPGENDPPRDIQVSIVTLHL